LLFASVTLITLSQALAHHLRLDDADATKERLKKLAHARLQLRPREVHCTKHSDYLKKHTGKVRLGTESSVNMRQCSNINGGPITATQILLLNSYKHQLQCRGSTTRYFYCFHSKNTHI
jgi:hypothetical protein